MSFDRQTLITLLKHLDNPDDDVVLKTAREIHQYIIKTQISWEQLLQETPSLSDDDISYTPEISKTQNDNITRINKLLSYPTLNEDTRQELKALLRDIHTHHFNKTDELYLEHLSSLIRQKSSGKP